MRITSNKRSVIVLLGLLPILLGVSAYWVRSLQPVTLRVPRRSTLFFLEFSPDGYMLAAAALRQMYVWDLRSSELKWSRQATGTGIGFTGLGFSPDGHHLILRSDMTSQYCETDTGRVIAWQPSQDIIGPAHFKPNSEEIISVAMDIANHKAPHSLRIDRKAPFSLKIDHWIPRANQHRLQQLEFPNVTGDIVFVSLYN